MLSLILFLKLCEHLSDPGPFPISASPHVHKGKILLIYFINKLGMLILQKQKRSICVKYTSPSYCCKVPFEKKQSDLGWKGP